MPSFTSSDGFRHPQSEQELVDLVNLALKNRTQIRVRGSTHSVARAIYTDPLTDDDNHLHRQHPPDGGAHLNVMLDCYADVVSMNPSLRQIEVQAGMHLGEDPSHPTGGGALEKSLLYRLSKLGWALPNLGGTTHQTVSGFLSTGSAGASHRHSFAGSIIAVRLIDGSGQVREFRHGMPDFDGVVVSFGLLGIISTITFQCDPAYNVEGEERYTTYETSGIDLFGNAAGSAQPRLDEWLRDNEYSRLEWWPQPGCERLEVWTARRIPAVPNFEPRPYHQFGSHRILEQFFAAVFLTISGNLRNPARSRARLSGDYDLLFREFQEKWRRWWIPTALTRLCARLAVAVLRGLVSVAIMVASWVPGKIKDWFPSLVRGTLSLFVPLGTVKEFWDYWWRAIPADLEADDEVFPVEFTEAAIPLSYACDVMQLMQNYFGDPSKPHSRLSRTGTLLWEIYAAPANGHWLSPAYTSGSDEWTDGIVRLAPYWFGNNPGRPADRFFQDFWNELRREKIPFRLHWGKHHPICPTKQERSAWKDIYEDQYPRWDDFLKLRAAMDPEEIFLTTYWKERLGL